MIKRKRILFRHFIIFTVAVVYLTVCFLLSIEQSISKYQSYDEAVKRVKTYPGVVLLDKFELTSEEYLFSLKNHVVAADTLIYGFQRDEKRMYLIAGILNSNDQRILLKLDVDSEIIEDYSKIKYKRAILTAYINDVSKLPNQAQIYSFDNKLVWENIKYDILLEGRLEELLYISPIQS